MFWAYVSMTLLMVAGLLMIFIILLQRGRGGGLAGAFGGLGGQSAFGTKAGDVFTKITVVVAVIWVLLASIGGFALRAGGKKFAETKPANTSAVESAIPPATLPSGTNDLPGFPVAPDTGDTSSTNETPSDTDKEATPDSPQPDESNDEKSEGQNEETPK